MTYTGELFTIYEEVDIANRAGVPRGDYIMIKSGRGNVVKIQMPAVPKGEVFRIRIPLVDPVIKRLPDRVVLSEDSALTSGPSAVWMKAPLVQAPRTPTKKTRPVLPPRPRKQRPQ